MTTKLIDLNDTELFVNGDPHAVWAKLRREAPVYWNDNGDGDGVWALTKYRDIHDVYLDPVTYSSEQGTVMGGSYRSEADSASGQMLICSDPPEHRLLRQQVHKGFTSAMMDRVTEHVTANVRAAVDRLLVQGGGDFATEVAPQLPAGFLTAVFGLDRDEVRHLLGLTRAMIGFRDPELNGGRDERMTLVSSQVEIFDLFAELIERRRRDPGDDLVSLLLAAEINGRPMTESQVLYNCLNVAVGGNETSPYTATAGVLALIEHPDQAARLRDDETVLPTAVEEIFRWTSTNAYVQRTATRDTEIRGTRIRAGQAVTIWNASANRDEDQFVDPDRFDLARTPNQHITFGVGAHRCIGMTAARREITIMFEQIRDRRVRFELVGPIERLRSNFMLGIKHLPVTARV